MNPLDCKYRVWHISVIVDEVIEIHLFTVKAHQVRWAFFACGIVKLSLCAGSTK